VATKKETPKRPAGRRAPAGLAKSGGARDHAEQAKGQAEEGDCAAPVVPEAKQKKERPVRCIHRHTDVEFRRAFPKVCGKLIEKAKDGSVQHTQVLLRMGEFDKAKTKQKRSGPSLSEMLLAELKRRQDEREAATGGEADTAQGSGE
jgi:hypothetical protein